MNPQRIVLSPGMQIALVSIIVFALVPHAVAALSFSAGSFFAGEFWRIITYPFVHLNIAHLLENVVTVIIAGMLATELGMSRQQMYIVFFGSSVLVALTSMAFLPLIIIAGASSGIFAILGGLSAKGNEFLSRWFLLPVMFSAVFIKMFISMFTGSMGEFSWAQLLFHGIGFIYGAMIFAFIAILRSKQTKRVLQVV
ncbi:rhomboid family intramembrane serine protease [Candidatus Woesearchaeota archaeon]|nr:rhomboid family intramembrane serine protease [Candidatus Woesearchaeota archaeon]